ncbi:MAG TPA: DUF2243 domain-containing protein [Kofleriaceae bacterium]|nr:DUF2243 domain-containing protein [Kofleriaceae bacterium]
MQGTTRTRIAPLVKAALVLGVGLGGFADGILLHQILQWHQMLSSVVEPNNLVAAKYNMMWDGLFHAVTWVTTVVGVAMLFRAVRRPDVIAQSRVLVGGMVTGWGLFNFVEGLIDHQILGIHHVHPNIDQLAWDVAFLFVGGLGLIGLGVLLIRGGRDHVHATAVTH